MIFSSKAEYGVRLMIELGRQAPEHPTSLKAIADAEGCRSPTSSRWWPGCARPAW